VRAQLEAIERQTLHPAAAFADASRGRPRPEPEDPLRTCFQRDRDRILHCKAFRRLAHKTQVFLSPEGDHYRTRITHTLEVAQIARTIARGLRLSESLTEAIVMGHDLGHTPFGHAGEAVLARLVPGGFHHSRQSLRVVDLLERDGAGLNLTHEVRDGILKHSKGKGTILGEEVARGVGGEGVLAGEGGVGGVREEEAVGRVGGEGGKAATPAVLAATLEGQVVRLSDILAYVHHDFDDALRARVLTEDQVPAAIATELGRRHGERVGRMVADVIASSDLSSSAPPRIRLSPARLQALTALRDFLYERVYDNPTVHSELEKGERILEGLWHHFIGHETLFRQRYWPKGVPEGEPLWRAVCDFLAGMTDRYAIRLYEELFMPRPWPVY
jgi:dGTPase